MALGIPGAVALGFGDGRENHEIWCRGPAVVDVWLSSSRVLGEESGSWFGETADQGCGVEWKNR